VLAEPRLSPAGDQVAFVANAARRGVLTTVPAAGGAELVVTADPPATPAAAYGGGAFDWLPAGDGFVFASTDGGLYQIPAGGGPARLIVGAGDHGRASCPAVSPDGSQVAYLADAHHVAVAALTEGGPWPRRLSAEPDFCFDPAWSPDGTRVVWHEWDVPAMPWDDSRIVVSPAAGSGPPQVLAGGPGIAVQQPRFSPDGRWLAYLSDESGWLNLWIAPVDGSGSVRPVVPEPFEHGGPAWGPGQRSFAWSPDSRSLAYTRNEAGFGRLCRVDLDTGACQEVAKGVHGGLSWVGPLLVALRSGARTPDEIVAYEMPGGNRGHLARGPVGGFEAAGLVEPEVVDWKAADGATVHGRLYRPATPAADLARPPLLVSIHGGPTGQSQASFVSRYAFFLARGWAILNVDYRGSTGWGRDYAQALNGHWGELDVEDTAAGMRHAAEAGWCDPRRMVPIGGSAGGFTVLLLLARYPELCAAGVDLYGVADLFDLDETTHRFEAHYTSVLVGSLPAAAEAYRDRSPVNLAEAIRSPLLILQGDADAVVPPAQSRAIADRLRALGREVEIHFYEGEGHGWLRPETIEDELVRTDAFLTRHVLQRRS
jgi:dipeptidyl aminopeptidase/acylaminoacyl peptidase